jgi:hypothetical protein
VVHEVVAVQPARVNVLVRATGEAELTGGVAGAEGEALDVIELELGGGAADAAVLERIRAAPAVALPHRAPDFRADVAGPFGGRRWRRQSAGRRRRHGLGRGLLARLHPDPPAFAVAIDDEIEADLEDDIVGRARVRVRERVPGRGELLEHAPRDGDVEPAELGGEGVDVRPFASRRRSRHIRNGKLARTRFFRENRTVGEQRQAGRLGDPARCQAERSHDGAQRRCRNRLQLRDDLLRLQLGGPEEPRQDLRPVLRRDDVRDLDNRREVQAAIPERLDDLRIPLDELRGRLPVVRRPLRQRELAGQEVEE